MAIRTANQAQFFLDLPTLDPNALRVSKFEGQEAISQLFRFDLELVSDDPEINFADVVNQPATLALEHGEESYSVHGLIADFQQKGRTKDWVAYEAVLVPRLWLLTLTHQSRIFQEMTVEDIVSNVLQEAGYADFEFQLQGSYDPREYTTQYQETDFNFISRLLEHEGIGYFFKHDDRDVLVMTDTREPFPTIEGPYGDSVVFYNPGVIHQDEDRIGTIQDIVCREKIVTGKVTLKDKNYRTPDTKLLSESQLNGDMPGEYYNYGDHFKTLPEGDRLALVRNEEIEGQRRVVTGSGTCLGFLAGRIYTLEHHYRADLNVDYLLTSVHHHGSQAGGMDTRGGDEGSTYRNTFTCIPASVPYRPPRATPRPVVPGLMTAEVETAGGDYAHLDDQGRYRVKMPFDLSDATNATASKAIRLAQPYSGPGYGFHFPNHAATEMVCACVDGNPDRPLGLSTVPNPNQYSPVTSNNRPQNVIRTWGKNELTFDDTKGAENILMKATKDHTVQVANNETISVGSNQSQSVGNNQTESIGNDQSLSVGNNQTITVGSDREKQVGANQTETIGIDKTITVGSNHTETIGQDMTITVGQNLSETVAINYSETVGVAMELTVGAAYTQTVGGTMTEDVGISKTMNVGKDLTLDVGGNLSEKVGKAYSVKAKSVTIEAEDSITLKAGSAQIVLKKSGDIMIKGKKIDIKGSGPVIIKGSKVTAN